MKLTLVTGSANKLKEWQRLLPADIALDHVAYDLTEIQSADAAEIATAKAKAAYELAGVPVVIEDVSAGLDSLAGLPGPYIKFFEEKLGPAALFTVAGNVEAAATATCYLAYYDGTDTLIFTGTTHGKTVSPRGENGFGFDTVFMPEGQTKTYAEMSPAEKDSLSHRSRAIAKLVEHLKSSA
ncbi:MAG: inosine triphosphate pyrophosphatase isoform [Candidatus Saccharibacteria bacterium]|nr:inosine triphosphate pyrophosphatase isoform [Candidatus Saccharibacteria bacterium]